jgi:NAD-dependent dihydropyrimidine dehydrogenase PreA subunit
MLASGCAIPPETAWLVLELPPGLAEASESVTVTPKIAEAARQVERGRVALSLKRAAGTIVIAARGVCPLTIDTRSLVSGSTQWRELSPLVDLGPLERVSGALQDFQIHARPRCSEGEQAQVTFSVVGGAPLSRLEADAGARTLRGRTAAPSGLAGSASLGIVPVSAHGRERHRTVLSARVRLASGETIEQRLGVSALARSSGLPNVAVTHPLLLAGERLQLLKQPTGSRARLRELSPLFELTPDLPGTYRVANASGQELSIKAGRYDETPLDCGRAECHRAIAAGASESAMTSVLESDLGGCHTLSRPECASACHATGEPGTADGGFSHVAQELGLAALPAHYDELPRALQRLGGVGCLACHGPGAVPEPSARWAIVQSDVCAVCHDAPPRYGHYAAWRSSRMSRSDADPRTRETESCRRCHTAAGFLGREAAPHDSPGMGISCSACHDVHPEPQSPSRPRAARPLGLLRDLQLPSSFDQPRPARSDASRVCVPCHAPSDESALPEASAAALVAGVSGKQPRTGEPLMAGAPHAAHSKGCLGCHDDGPSTLERGRGHAFAASSSSCLRCHEQVPARDGELRARAVSLFTRLTKLSPAAATALPHAGPLAQHFSGLTVEHQRAIYNVLLVLEDRAADVHNPAYSKILLDAAERSLPGVQP